jgi:hypothetical protein
MSILTEIGVTPEPIITVMRISVPASGLFSGGGKYPAQTLDTALQAVITDFELVEAKVAEIELGSKIQLPCAETILEGYAVRINASNQLEKCSAFSLPHINSLIGLAKQTGNTGETISVFEDEIFTNSTWSWTPNKPVFLGLNGTLTQTPVGVAYLQQVGIAISPTSIIIRISQPLKRV